jgi:Protein of unknown function (DUF2752)
MSPISALVGAAGLAAVWSPGDEGVGVCVFRAVTGHWCPGCGMTRSVMALLRGDVDISFTYHPYGIVLLAQAAVFAVWRFSGRTPRPGILRPWLVVNAAALLAVFAYRLTLGSFPEPGTFAV